MPRPIWFVTLLKKVYGKSKYLPILLRLPFLKRRVENFVKKDKLYYITKEKVIPINQEVDKPEDMILPSKVVEYFIEKSNYRWIMNFCICRSGKNCKKYPHDIGCLFMGKAVNGINPKLGRLVSKKEALDHVKKCRELGLIHTIGRNKLDALWLDAWPDNRLLTVCNCCECCCISKLLAQGGPKIRAIAHKMPGVHVDVSENCVGCGTCAKGICIYDAIQIVNKKAIISKECLGCGRCVEICPRSAIKLTLKDNEFINKVIEEIESLVDVT